MQVSLVKTLKARQEYLEWYLSQLTKELAKLIETRPCAWGDYCEQIRQEIRRAKLELVFIRREERQWKL